MMSNDGLSASLSSVPVGSVGARDLALRCGSLTDAGALHAESAWCSEAGRSATSIRTDLSLLSLLLQPKVHTNVALSRNTPSLSGTSGSSLVGHSLGSCWGKWHTLKP